MAAEADYIAYASCPGGVTNQKLALLGLFLRAVETGRRKVILPDMLIFDPVHRQHVPVPFGEVFDVAQVQDFASRSGIEILDRPPCGEWGDWDYVVHALRHIALSKLEDRLGTDSITCDFFRSLSPLIRASEAMRELRAHVHARQISIAAQFRIEHDWAAFVANYLSNIAGSAEQNLLSFDAIVRKIRDTLPDAVAGIYVASNEAGLPVPKHEMQAIAKRDFGIDLYWKSDFLDSDTLRGLSALDLSLMDFEVSIDSRVFVGLSRSTFSSAISLEKYARTGHDVRGHYIYNASGHRLAERDDNGAFEQPSLAADRYHREKRRAFHEAQIYLNAGKHELALRHYSTVAESGDASDQELYISLSRCAEITLHLGGPVDAVIDTWLRAAAVLPDRAEALHGAARLCRVQGRYAQGYEIAGRAITLAVPESGLMIERWVYEYGALDEYAVNAWWAGHYLECVIASSRALAGGHVPPDQRERILANAKLALERL